MYLKSLEIQGFKSFSERTVILFHPGVTAIVGPNGSGKSNVTDAIRWVLGEQSAKALRGGKMEDVIFSGTNTRRPLGFAEVTMLIDNSDGLLPVEYSEVAIARRLYRSGESNYLINKNPCRLKDVHALFMDTGLGRDGYSIIGQGRVDEILSTRSEDRRRVFEEASGIQKYKTRRDEALKKLEHTEANLTRVNDILSELDGQLNPLKKQAELAKQYLAWYEELKALDVALILHTVDQKSLQHKEFSEKFQSVLNDVSTAEAQGLRLEEGHRKLRERLAELNEQLRHRRNHKDERSSQREARIAALAAEKQEKEQIGHEILAQQSLVTEIAVQLEQLAAELAERAQLDAAGQQRLNGQEAEQTRCRSELDAFMQELQTALEAVQKQRSELGETQRALVALSSESARLAVEDEHLDLRMEELEAEQIRLDEQCLTTRAEAEKKAAELEDIGLQGRQQFAHLEKAEQELSAARNDLAGLQARYNEQVQSLDQLGFKLDTLREMQQNMDGYNEPVKRILQRVSEQPRLKRAVRGSLGSLIEVPGEYERAVEIALGAGIQNLVVEDDATASELIRILKTERMGRVSFLPLNMVAPRYLPAETLRALEAWKDQGYLGLAHELIGYKPEISKAVELLLARTVICDNLQTATRMAKAFKQSLKIVSLEGDVVNPGGSMSGGAYKNQSSLLSRNRLIAELLAKLKAEEKELPLSEKKIERAQQALRTQTAAVEAAGQANLLLQQQFALCEAQCRQLRENLEALSERRAQVEAQKRALAERKAESKGGKSVLDEREDALRRELAAREKALTEAEEANSLSLKKRESLRAALADSESLYQQLYQQLQAQRSIDERIENERERLLEQSGQREERIAALRQQATTLELQLVKSEEELRLLNAENQAQDAELFALEKEQADYDQRAADLFDELRRHSSELSAIESEKNRLENKSEQLALLLDEQRNRLWEQYSLTYDNAKNYRNPDLQLSVVEPRVKELRQSIRGLGPVNVNAVEDFQTLSERYDFLKKQESDILAAKSQLDGLVEELTAVMRKQFGTNFTQINQNFQEVFRELFGGGKAEISLEMHKDILEADIEIKASPPGKKLQNMLLLSGGERSLAAIALLFAILKLRPTPFCVLDEIEAALDDSNVFRFTDYIKNYADKSQFILVTHRKGTMEAADSLYGVTMQELGVSRILSMKLSD